MLKSAYAYEEKLQKAYKTIIDDPHYMFWNYSNYWHKEITLSDNTYNDMSFVSINNGDNVIGYLSATIDRNINAITSLSIMNFTKKLDIIFSKDLYSFLDSLFTFYNFDKIHFHVVVGNPAEVMYDKYIKKYNGNIIGIFKKDTKLQDGKLYDVKHYEIFKDDYLGVKK